MRKLQYNDIGPRPYLQAATEAVIVPAPTGGWNAKDPLALMEPKYAAILDNWIPRPGYLELRSGYTPWSQGLASNTPVESLLSYRAASGERFFAACGSQIFEVTNQGQATVVQSGLSNARWQQVMFTPALGLNYLYIVNGQDAPRYFNGTTWTQPSITGTTNAPSTFTNIAVWKRRIWFVEGSSTIATYLATDAIQGAVAGELDIGALLNKGGHLIAIATMTTDGGNGPDDLLVLISTRGEVVIYKGTDPTNASAFSLVGVFALPPPLGNRCFMDLDSDLAIITLQGVIPLSQALPLDAAAVRGIALTNNIQNVMLQVAAQGQNNFGWEMIHYPAQGFYILNVPLETNSSQEHFAMNAVTGAWWRGTGWASNCFGLYNDQLYFGDNVGNVNLAYSGAADSINPIAADMQCAFNYFGDPGKIKRVTMVQPALLTSGQLIPSLSVDVDFGTSNASSLVQSFGNLGAQYDSGTYDSSTYALGQATQTLWQGVQAEGRALAIRMKINALPQTSSGISVFDTGTFDMMVFDGFGTGNNLLQVNAFTGLLQYGGII